MTGAQFAISEAIDMELEEWLASAAERWQASGSCPDPHFYLKVHSPRAKRFGSSFSHYLIVGADSFIEMGQ